MKRFQDRMRSGFNPSTLNASTQTVVDGRCRSFLFWLKQHRQIDAPPFRNVKSSCAIAAPGCIDVRKNLRYRCCWQHNKTGSIATHEFTGIFAFQRRHESTDLITKIPNQTRFGKLDGAEFHFGFQAKPAVTRKIIAWKKSCEKWAKKKRDCYVNRSDYDRERS